MSDDEKKSRRGTGETARRIWLAGIGAYGRAFTEAQEALKEVTGGTSRVFDELVQKGEMIELAVDHKRKDLMDKANLSSLNMDDRIAAMRSRLMRGEDVADDISDMDARITAMEAKLDKIIALLEDKPKPARKRTTTKKAASSKKQ